MPGKKSQRQLKTRENSRSSSDNNPPVTPTDVDFMRSYQRFYPAEISPAEQPSLRSSNSKAEQPASTDKKTKQLVVEYAKKHNMKENTVRQQLRRAKCGGWGSLSPPKM